MGKLPSFQFYPGDWIRDPVSGCSLAAQGLWLRMLFIAHDADRYGYLAMNGAPIPPENLARACGISVEQYATLLAELDRVAVPSYTDNGTIFSRRMVLDARKRAEAAQRQAKSRGSVTHESQPHHGPVTEESQPSSSSVFPLPSARGEDGNVPGSRPAAGGKPRRAPKGGESGSYPSLDDALAEARSLGLPAWKCEAWWTQMEGFGWVVKGKPVRNWRALLNNQMTLWVRDGGKQDPPYFANKMTAHKVETSPLEADIDKLLREVKALE